MPHCRCARCGSRRTLAKHPDEYQAMPACLRPSCYNRTKREGKRQRWRVDHWRARNERGARNVCNDMCCDYAFPHRRGSLGCCHNPNFHAEGEPPGYYD